MQTTETSNCHTETNRATNWAPPRLRELDIWDLALVAGGGILAGYGLRRALPGLALTAAGLGLAYYAFATCQEGECSTPEIGHEPVAPVDPIDEASWESFPASDSPAYSRSV